MSVVGTNRPKKRGRPAKYASKDEKKAANAARRRTQRKNTAVGAQEVQFQQHYIAGPGQATFFWPALTQLVSGGPSTPKSAVGVTQNFHEGLIPNKSNNIRELLLLLSPLGSPSLDPISTKINDVTDHPQANSEVFIGTRGSGEAECDDIITTSDRIGVIYKDRDSITNNIVIDQEREKVSKVAD